MSETSYIERKIVEACIDELLAHGAELGVNDGEEVVLQDCRDRKAILGAMFSTDEDYLLVSYGVKHGWVHFIYGNGANVLSDYITWLEPYLTKTDALIEEIQA